MKSKINLLFALALALLLGVAFVSIGARLDGKLTGLLTGGLLAFNFIYMKPVGWNKVIE